MILRRALDDRRSNHRRHTHPQITDSIAWVALVKRLVAQDEVMFSGWMLMPPVRSALAKRYFRTQCMRGLQVREEQPSSLQVRCLKPFRKPGVHVLKPTSRVG